MSRLKPNAREDNNVQPSSDSPGRSREPLQSHTLSQKNNAAGLSSDEHENPLNGTQPKPFVYSSVPAVPRAGNSLPSGALVNGPASHPTSEVHCVLNKGTVLSNNVLDATWQPGKDTSPEVLPPPRELQSDAWKNTAGPVVKTPATQPGASAPPPPPRSQQNESKLARAALPGEAAEQTRISQPLTKQTIKAESRRDARRPESSSDGHDSGEAEERFADSAEKLYDGAHFCRGGKSVLKGFPRSASPERRACGPAAPGGVNEADDREEKDTFTPKQPKKEQLEEESLLFSCGTCNVNFKEKRHFHRHMMYHLGEHNQVNRDNVPRPFICRECGRLFCDSNSLVRHIIIHQDRLKKLMQEIKALESSDFHHGGSRGQRPGCLSGSQGSQIFVQRATTRDNLRHYYFCGDCNHIALTRRALEAHLHAQHLGAHPTASGNATGRADHVGFCCEMGAFACDLGATRREGAARRRYRHYKNYSKTPKFSSCEVKPRLGEASRFPHRSSKKGNICDKKSDATNSEKATKPSQLRCCAGYAKNALPPSLWKIDKHGKLHLQPANTLDVATDLTCVEQDENNNDHEAFGSGKQANSPGTVDFLLSTRNLKLDQMLREESGSDPVSGRTQEPGNPNSPLVRKISAPLHTSVDNMHGDAVPRLRQRPQRQSADSKLEKASEGSENFSGNPAEAGGGLFESGENERNPCARRYFRKRPRFSAEDRRSRVLPPDRDGDEDCSDIQQLVIKEEDVHAAADAPPAPEVEHKRCPYCPAAFESGVGLSNHVRGHLHRLGLSYDARHTVSPEQVALRDQQPRSRRRRRIATGTKRLRGAVGSEAAEQHRCLLCWACFHTKTGLSNHVRGHLKRVGRSVSCGSKSPLRILSDLLRDRMEHHGLLQVLDRKLLSSGAHVPQNFGGGGGGSSDVVAGPPVKLSITDHFIPKQETGSSSRRELQITGGGGGGISSTLVKLLEENHRTHKNMQGSFATRKLWDVSGDCPETSMTSLEPSRRGQGYDYEQRTPRPRAGLKNRILPPLNAEIYTLTCRFCDLVFRGPLSIQEDWIRHLQRHLQHTGVPNSGTGMVEVDGQRCKNTNWRVA